MNLLKGDNNIEIVMEEIPAPPQGRIGQWRYRVACSQPTIHVEEGNWPNHALAFDFDLFPSTFTIYVRCHNDSSITILAELVIVDTNGHITWQPSQKSIGPGSSREVNFAAGLPRVRGQYYFDAILSFDGVIVDEGRWIINYY